MPDPSVQGSDEERVAELEQQLSAAYDYWSNRVARLEAALGPQLTAEEKDAIPLLLEAAQNYDTRLPAEQGGEAQHSLVAKLSLIANGEKR